MSVLVREFGLDDLPAMLKIWNEVVDSGVAFPQIDELSREEGLLLFRTQSFTGVAVDESSGEILGMYILHPNNIGRCGHICNASYAVSSAARGRHVGELLVRHCIATARDIGFGILQFNAVVKSNIAALSLYKKIGFEQLGTIPKGFLMKDGTYEDIIPHYLVL